ncbi:AAA family ATPase [Vibrio parahaemolyticus]
METMMIKEINITGFKSFPEKVIPLTNFTLLSGLNNSGKSSVIQALRMLESSYRNNSPLLDGYGDIDDIRSDHVHPSSEIEFSIEFNDGSTQGLTLNNEYKSQITTFPELLYIGADRLGPQANLPIDFSLYSSPRIGDRGEFTYDFITKLTSIGYTVPSDMFHLESRSPTFEYQLRGWLSEIAPGVEFKYSTNRKSSVSHAEMDSYKPMNVGFGLSYTLPIIAATLGATCLPPTLESQASWVINWEIKKTTQGILLIIENPEAHLHPQGQTAMGKMLAKAAACGVQVIVETHSEHVMDGVRIAIKEGALNHTDALFHYFEKSTEGLTEIKTPSIDENGKISFWPNGFFDQTLKNRAFLAKRSK